MSVYKRNAHKSATKGFLPKLRTETEAWYDGTKGERVAWLLVPACVRRLIMGYNFLMMTSLKPPLAPLVRSRPERERLPRSSFAKERGDGRKRCK